MGDWLYVVWIVGLVVILAAVSAYIFTHLEDIFD